jgi:hypothetical protein
MKRLIAMALLLGFAAPAFSQSVEIKGLSVGMTKAEVQDLFPTWKGFTVAGVPSKYPSVSVLPKYHEDRLDQLMFFFNPDSFATVLDAVKSKYPNLKCVDSKVGNAMGAQFSQVECTMGDSSSVLQLTRFVGDINTSGLSLLSRRSLAEDLEKAKQTKKDI